MGSDGSTPAHSALRGLREEPHTRRQADEKAIAATPYQLCRRRRALARHPDPVYLPDSEPGSDPSPERVDQSILWGIAVAGETPMTDPIAVQLIGLGVILVLWWLTVGVLLVLWWMR
jgi:hypothetical protein